MANPRSILAVLTSGGLDSDVLVADLARTHRVIPFYVRQGMRWEAVELFWLKRFLKTLRRKTVAPLQVLSLPMVDVYGQHWSVRGKGVPAAQTPDESVYLPGRNLTLLVKAAVFCAMNQVSSLALGSLGHNPFSDATPAFFRQWEKTLSMALGRRLHIKTPYRAWSKVQVIRQGKNLPLELSFSCLSPVRRQHCGRCNKCAERQGAFREASVRDRTIYAHRPHTLVAGSP